MATRRLLATDLDGTFLGDEESMALLVRSLEDHGIMLAFSTGRYLASIEQLYVETTLSFRADVCLCMVGTEIHHYHREGGSYHLDRSWQEWIGQGWDQTGVERIMDTTAQVRKQDIQWQTPFKSSYYLEENAETCLNEIRHRLVGEGIRAKVIYSSGRFLDLIPIRAGKGEAVRHVAQSLGVDADQVITCGDSGNDLDMMREELGFRAIVVGNALEELKTFCAPHVYHARAHYAAGILEGLQAYGWL